MIEPIGSDQDSDNISDVRMCSVIEQVNLWDNLLVINRRKKVY